MGKRLNLKIGKEVLNKKIKNKNVVEHTNFRENGRQIKELFKLNRRHR